MKNNIKSMVDEHSQLVQRLNALDAYVYSDASDKDDEVEFANMRQYEKALHCILKNVGVLIAEDGRYCEVIEGVTESATESNE